MPKGSNSFSFTLEGSDAGSRARAGMIHTPHGDVPTPAFMPVGTQATVKTLTPDELMQMGTTIVLANTYHLYLRPGEETIAALGGLHSFMGWDGPLLTDSGGFQVFSLQDLRHVSDEGVTFRSHLDGSEHFFSPQKVVAIQERLGADIIMVLDECAVPFERGYIEAALQRTHLWAEACLAAQTRTDQALYGIVQGGIFPDLREESAKFLSALDFPGYAIGGLSVGESKGDMHRMLEITVPLLPDHKPRYLMGVGSPEDLLECVARGIDQMDCVLPTRLARNGAVFTHRGRINLRNAEHKTDGAPIEDGCGCYTCQRFSRAYLNHLIKAKEILGLRLNTIHNVHFLLELMRTVRQSILDGCFVEFKDGFLADYETANSEAREAQGDRWRGRGRAHPATNP